MSTAGAFSNIFTCVKHMLHQSHAAVVMQHFLLFPYKLIVHSPRSSIIWLQAGWGKCNESFMKDNNYCQATCGRCSSCSNTPPDNKYTCAQQVCINWQLDCLCCAYGWQVLVAIYFMWPLQVGFGKCSESWMTSGGFCKKSCGRC